MEKEVTIKFDNAQAAEPVKATIDGDFGGGEEEGGVVYSNDKSILTLHLFNGPTEKATYPFNWYNDGPYEKTVYLTKEEYDILTKYQTETDSESPLYININGTLYRLTNQMHDETWCLGEYVSIKRGWDSSYTIESIMIGYDDENFGGDFFNYNKKTI